MKKLLDSVHQEITFFDYNGIKTPCIILSDRRFEEIMQSAAGKPTSSSINELEIMVREINREPVQRDTFFNVINKF